RVEDYMTRLPIVLASLCLLPAGFAFAQKAVSCKPSDGSRWYKKGLNIIGNTNKLSLGYHKAREFLFQVVDAQKRDDGTKFVECVYSHQIFRIVTSGIPNGGVNTEHTFPQSRLKRYPRFEESKADLYHLFPTE